MPDIPFTFPNGVRGTVSEDGKINLLGKAPTGNEPATALPRPSGQEKNQTDDELGIDPGIAPSAEYLRVHDPMHAPDAPLIHEDPVGDVLVGNAMAKPVGVAFDALANPVGEAIGGAASKVGSGAAKVARAVGTVIKPSAKHAVVGAAEGAATSALHGGNPVRGAVGGAVAGGLLGKTVHGKLGKILKKLSDEDLGEAVTEAATPETPETPGTVEEPAAPAAPAPTPEAVAARVQPAPIAPPIPSKVDMHLTTLAGPAGPAGVAALKAVALKPSGETLRAAVAAGIPPAVALQVAKLGAQVAQ